MKKALYPGSFDPIHEGHIQVIKKALKLFDEIIVVVSINPDKEEQTPINIRLKVVKESLADFKNVKVISNNNNLISHIAREMDINYIVRSARNKTDYNYELELAAGNHFENNALETILIMPNFEYINYSSTLERHKKKLGVKC
ncbi:pantetheine-phosphate adenylyltransferase [Mycoplasma elephantis]|uniref:pantetheine-phosphate adenylyltransferase n=1 Tax=Mycoplasma elephantis TaxID=114882 RepID=UPI00048A162C|nr:pantetheine-phosphate adenylyltransferase [Mycoplasma elephantis]